MWGWQGLQHQTQQQDNGQNSAQVPGQGQQPDAVPGAPGPQPQELSNMLQMLQDKGGAAGFEDLTMFNANF